MLYRAPGRVNIIGEHVDYNDGFVLPFAIDRYVEIEAEPYSCWSAVSELDGREYEFSVTQKNNNWTDYIAGVVHALAKRGIDCPPQRFVIRSNLPAGAGLSSSAALEVAAAAIVCDFAGCSADAGFLAEVAWEAETGFVGMPCGIMDQFAVAYGKQGYALFLDTMRCDFVHVGLGDSSVGFFIIDSGIKHELASSEYAVRRHECEQALKLIGKNSFRDVLPEDLAMLDGVLKRRARHVITENRRSLAMVGALTIGDFITAGRLITESHISLRDDYDVSCPEIDWLVDRLLESPLTLGARMVGGGFGGSVLVLSTSTDSICLDGILADYKNRWGISASVFAVKSSDGVHKLL